MTSEAGASVKPVRLTVITSEFGAAANVGGAVETSTRTFDLPAEISAYIRSQKGTWTNVSFALERES